MKKTTKKGPSKVSHKKQVKDLDVKPARGGKVRGGEISIPFGKIHVDYSNR